MRMPVGDDDHLLRVRKSEPHAIEKARSGRPAHAAAPAAEPLGLHVGPCEFLFMATAVAIEAIVRAAVDRGADQLPACGAGFGLFPLPLAGLAAQCVFTARDLPDTSELPADGVSTARTVEPVPVVVGVTAQPFEARGGGVFPPAIFDAMRAKRDVVHQHVAHAAMLPAAAVALEHDLIPIRTTARKPKPLVACHLPPMRRDRRRHGKRHGRGDVVVRLGHERASGQSVASPLSVRARWAAHVMCE